MIEFLQDMERRDSIPETIPEGKPVVSKLALPAVNLGIHDIPEKNENCTCVCTCNEGSKTCGAKEDKKVTDTVENVSEKTTETAT